MITHGEEWREIPDEIDYLASSWGRIKSLKNGSGSHRKRLIDGILTQVENAHGYLVVCLSHNGQVNTEKVHHLVASAFYGPCSMGMCVHHRNGDKKDNRPENLEYMSRCAHVSLEMSGERHPNAKLTTDNVRDIRRLYADGNAYHLIASLYGVHRSTIRDIILLKSWKHI